MSEGENTEPPEPITACTIGSDRFCQEVNGECEICGIEREKINDD